MVALDWKIGGQSVENVPQITQPHSGTTDKNNVDKVRYVGFQCR